MSVLTMFCQVVKTFKVMCPFCGFNEELIL